MTTEAISNKQDVAIINSQYHNGELSYREAVSKLQKVADRINARGVEIAKKYNRRYSKFTGSQLLSHGGSR